jgi:DNA-binding transcriptional regulator YiaG
MTPTQFRAAIARLGLTQSSLARLLSELGDPADPKTILRRVQRWATGDHSVPGEVVALLTLLHRHPIKRQS